MGGVWCKADRTAESKSPFNTKILRWTENVRHAYRKPKPHRPPRPPQKPLRINEKLIISHPHLNSDASPEGWRTATLLVPDPAPVPPPRKKRKRNKEITRTAFSMDDLSRVDSFTNSTISLHDKYHSELGLDCRSSSSTLVVTPVLESRLEHTSGETSRKHDDNKENITITVRGNIEEEPEEEIDSTDEVDAIVPVEKDILFNTRTIIHSNLGYVDKLSAISEVSAESGFDDRTDPGKSSEMSGSVTSLESISVKEANLNILAHIENINNVSHPSETKQDIREKTAISKKEWLQNILKEEPTPFEIHENTDKTPNNNMQITTKIEIPAKIETTLKNEKTIQNIVTSEFNDSFENIEPLSTSTPMKGSSNHSILLKILQVNTDQTSNTLHPFAHKEESIFMTNTKTNVIYKSLSSDNLTDNYIDEHEAAEQLRPGSSLPIVNGDDISKLDGGHGESKRTCSLDKVNTFSNSASEHYLRDYSFETPKLVENETNPRTLSNDKSIVVTSFDFKDLKQKENYLTAMKDLNLTSDTSSDVKPVIAANGVTIADLDFSVGDKTDIVDLDNDKPNTKDTLTKKLSTSSSRRSSITDSLHEFEMSIYDMLNESKKNRDSSDEDESLKVVTFQKR